MNSEIFHGGGRLPLNITWNNNAISSSSIRIKIYSNSSGSNNRLIFNRTTSNDGSYSYRSNFGDTTLTVVVESLDGLTKSEKQFNIFVD